MPMSSKSARVMWVDLAKGMSILLVVFYHVWAGIDRRADEIRAPQELYAMVNPVFTAVRMPLFFFVAGMFAVRSLKKPWGVFLSAKASAILWPYLVWSVLQSVLNLVLAKVRGAEAPVSLAQLPERLLLDPVDQFWFLYVLFLALLLFYGLNRLLRKAWALTLVSFLMLMIPLNVDLSFIRLGSASLSDWGPFFQLCQFFLYMALGSLLGPKLLAIPVLPSTKLLVGISLGCFLAVICSVHGIQVERDTTAMLLGIEWPIGLPVAFLAVASCIAFAMLLERWGPPKLLLAFGRDSVWLFVLHVILAAAYRAVLLKLGIRAFLPHLIGGCLVGSFIPLAVAWGARTFHLQFLVRFPSEALRFFMDSKKAKE